MNRLIAGLLAASFAGAATAQVLGVSARIDASGPPSVLKARPDVNAQRDVDAVMEADLRERSRERIDISDGPGEMDAAAAVARPQSQPEGRASAAAPRAGTLRLR